MIAYILVSSSLLLLLFAFYRLVLANQTSYHFNRFFILMAIVIGLLYPAFDHISKSNQYIFRPGDTVAGIDIEQVTNVRKAPAKWVTGNLFPAISNPEVQDLSTSETASPLKDPVTDIFNWHMIVSLIYIVITLTLLIRFIAGILTIYRKARGLESIQLDSVKLYLSNDPVTPHSFMDWVFVNKEDYKNGLINDDILKHEIAHIRDKHTLDVLFVELLSVFFWLNPGIHLFKNELKLIHEYIADRDVLKDSGEVTSYQNKLLELASGHQLVRLASNLNFKLTKKRLLMMTRNTSLWRKTLSMFLISPAIPLLFLYFNSQVIDTDHISGKYQIELIADTVDAGNDLSYVLWETEEGERFSGSNKYFYNKTGILGKESIYKEGYLLETRSFNSGGVLWNRTIYTYKNGLPLKSTEYMSGNLYSELIHPLPENNFIGTQRYWNEANELYYEAQFLRSPKNFHGLVTSFDRRGQIEKQERYEYGELVEKIK